MLPCNLIRALPVLSCLSLLSAGCSDSSVPGRPATVPATVTVTYQGTPVAGASVVLFPQQPDGKPAVTLTDTSGKGRLFTFDPGDGAIAGQYTALVSKAEPVTLSGEEIYALVEKGRTPPEPKELLPAKYRSPETAGLAVSIEPAGANDIQLVLTD